jgi:hypothetical protein
LTHVIDFFIIFMIAKTPTNPAVTGKMLCATLSLGRRWLFSHLRGSTPQTPQRGISLFEKEHSHIKIESKQTPVRN